MTVPTKTTSKSTVSSSNINDKYEKTISEYQKYKYQIINQTDTSAEMVKPRNYAVYVIVFILNLALWLADGSSEAFWFCSIVGFGNFVSFLVALFNKRKVFIRITKTGALDVTGYTLEKSRVSKKTVYIVIGGLVALVALLLIVFAVSMSRLSR